MIVYKMKEKFDEAVERAALLEVVEAYKLGNLKRTELNDKSRWK